MTDFDGLPDGDGLVRIADGEASVVLAPRIGGAIAAYRWETSDGTLDWLRPAAVDAIRRADAGSMSCFPLVPYSNRIRNGKFRFRGEDVRLPVSPSEDPHFEHGHGWRKPWEVLDVGPGKAVMRYVHEADEWPWRYEAVQQVSLIAGALVLDLSIRNLSERFMPAGLGIHPYFPVTPKARVEARVDRMWETDSEVLPTRLVRPRDGADPNTGIEISALDIDNVFTGWTGNARIIWPEKGASLALNAEGRLHFLVLYAQRSEADFCVEPVSNATDAFNLGDADESDVGVTALASGDCLAARIELCPEIGTPG